MNLRMLFIIVVMSPLVMGAVFATGCAGSPRVGGGHAPAAAPPVDSSRPLTPEARAALTTISRLSPENTLAWLKRSDAAPASPRPERLMFATIETWLQPGVPDGRVRQMVFDPDTGRLWIVESAGSTGRQHWFGPVRVDAAGMLVSAE